jgi:hypothetical protein
MQIEYQLTKTAPEGTGSQEVASSILASSTNKSFLIYRLQLAVNIQLIDPVFGCAWGAFF